MAVHTREAGDASQRSQWSGRIEAKVSLTDVPDSCYRRGGFSSTTPRRPSMATRAKKPRGKSGRTASSRSTKAGTKKKKSSRGRSAASASGSARNASARSSSSNKGSAAGSAGTRKAASGKPTVSAKRAQNGKAGRSSSKARTTPMERVTRVATEVAHQAGSAVVAGVEAIKDLGSTVVDRVTG